MVYSAFGDGHGIKRKTRRVHRCDACGRFLPIGSSALEWSVWLYGRRRRVRICDECLGPIYGCDRESKGIKVDVEEEWFVREMCARCDSFPFCDRVTYLKDSRPGDVYFGGLEDGGEVHPDG